MKRIRAILALCVFYVLVSGVPLHAAAGAAGQGSDRSPGAPLATALTTVTGIAISPLLGTGAYGAYRYFTADTPTEKAALPWFAQLGFWLPALCVVGACAAKDSLAAVMPPGWKKPLDVLETIESKASGLVAAGAVVPFTMDAMGKLLLAEGGGSTLSTAGLATIHFAAADLSWLLNLLTVPFGIAVFAFVWMASHAINVLILLSPWGAIDAALKTVRTALLGLVTVASTLSPWVGAVLSLVVIVVAFLVAGWSFRLTVFGSVFCWDFLTLRKRRFAPASDSNPLFSGGRMIECGVPMRTFGRVVVSKEDKGRALFLYRPWLVLPERRVEIELKDLAVGKGLFFSTVRDDSGNWFLLPPRYRDHEARFAEVYGLPGGVCDAGLRKAWSALKELVGRAPIKGATHA